MPNYFKSSDGSPIRTFSSEIINERLGFDAFVVDDLNGDGIADYVISGQVDLTATSPGLVYVIAGVRP